MWEFKADLISAPFSKWWPSLQIFPFLSLFPHSTLMKLSLFFSFQIELLQPLLAFSNLNTFYCIPQGIMIHLVLTSQAAVTHRINIL